VRLAPFAPSVDRGALRRGRKKQTINGTLHVPRSLREADRQKAPTIKKVSIRSRASKPSSTSQRRSTGYPSGNDAFKTTKEDKRRIKHSSLISRIEKSSPKVQKRRRPSKKLITNLQSLVDALPDATSERTEATIVGDARIRHKSLKSKPGAMKKKERLEKSEMDRFSKNLAQMAHVTDALRSSVASAETLQVEASSRGSSQRWAALRSHIQSTWDRDAGSKGS
jgi:hypothetical protein